LTESPVIAGIYKYALPYDLGEDAIQRSDLMCKYVVNLLANNVAKVFYTPLIATGVWGHQVSFAFCCVPTATPIRRWRLMRTWPNIWKAGNSSRQSMWRNK
jgi:hypothetical protein